MNIKLRKKLLQIEDKEKFEELLISISSNYFKKIELWDKELIDHYLKIANMSYERFKWGFNPTPPPDYFEDEDDE